MSKTIGVDLGTSTVKMVQIRNSNQSLQLIAAGSAEIPREHRDDFAVRMEYLGRGIRSIMKTKVFKGNECVLALPGEATFIQHMKIPKLPANRIPAALRWELQGKLPYPVEDAVVRHIVAGDVFGDGDAKQEVIVVAAARSMVESCLAMSRRAKLDVIAVNIESCAIVECFARLFQPSEADGQTTVYLDMGDRSTQVVLAHGSRIVFARNVATGGGVFDQVVANGLGIPIDEANELRRAPETGGCEDTRTEQIHKLLDEPIAELSHEVTQCLRYHESIFRNQGVERLVFLGCQANDRQLCQAIAQRLNLAAQVGDPLVQVDKAGAMTLGTGLDGPGPQPGWAVAEQGQRPVRHPYRCGDGRCGNGGSGLRAVPAQYPSDSG